MWLSPYVVNAYAYSSHRRGADTDKTKLSCLVGVGGVNWVDNNRRQCSVVLNMLETEQFCPESYTRMRCELCLKSFVNLTQFPNMTSQFAVTATGSFVDPN